MTMAQVLGPIGNLADHATGYAEAGLEVFPVNPRTKTPLTPHGAHDATCDVDQVNAWWLDHPDALIGHRLAAHHIILDIDPRHNGLDTWAALKDVVGELPLTRIHVSGRNDKGGHAWWDRPADHLSINGLDDWAHERGLGHATGGKRWSCGVDLLHRDHRYTILPPSPHPITGAPYQWVRGRGLGTEPAPLPALIADLIVTEPAPPPAPPRDPDPNSIADWYSHTHGFAHLLAGRGWRLVAGDGDSDGSRWRHPTATAACSATVRHRCLFVYSPNTAFEVTEPGHPHGYTPFSAWTVLEHDGDASRAARAARAAKDDTDETGWARPAAGATVTMPPVELAEADEDPDLDAFLATDDPDYDWLVPGLLERGDRLIVTGPEGAGKSTLLRQMAVAAASGVHPLGGDPLDEPLTTMIVDCENSARQVRRAIRPLRDAAGDSYGGRRLRLRILGASVELARVTNEADLAARIERYGVDMLVIGPIYKLMADDPKDEQSAKAVANALDRLRAIRGTAIVIEAHSPYADGTRTKRPIRPYGASLWSRWPEFGIHIDTDGKLEHWRGQRDERAFPLKLERGTPWPWIVAKSEGEQAGEWHGPTECANAVVAVLAELDEELSLNKICSELRARGLSYRRQTIADAARMARNEGRLDHRLGPRTSDLYTIAKPRLEHHEMF